MLWVGTSPSARAAPASRQPPTSTRPARSSAGAHDAQSTYGSSGCGALPCAVGADRACGRRPPSAARRRARRRRRLPGGRGRGCGTAPAGRGRTCGGDRAASTIVPPSRSGDASRQSRIACPSPVAAAVIGFSGSRGSCSDIHGSGTTIVSSCPASGIPRSETPRSSASACETAGGPASTATGRQLPPDLLQGSVCGPRPGSTLTRRRSGECAIAVTAAGEEGSRDSGRLRRG